jgi:sulfur-oxidizing protein SoxY
MEEVLRRSIDPACRHRREPCLIKSERLEGKDVRMIPRRTMMITAAGAGVLLAAHPGRAQTADNDRRWADLQPAIFPDRTVADDSAVLAIEAPAKAMDAALVPVSIVLLAGPDRARIRRITLIVDANPSPLAAAFTLGADAGIRRIATRIRVDDFTYLHAVAELDDGRLLAARHFIRAAGGCSAPAAQEINDGRMIGAIRVRAMPPDETAGPPDGVREVKVLINHPNYSGMQMNQSTRQYVPAYFVNHVQISQGDRALLAVDSGISIAENPEYRLDFRADAAPLRVQVLDSENNTYAKDYVLPPA